MKKLFDLIKWVRGKWNSIWKIKIGVTTVVNLSVKFEYKYLEDLPNSISEDKIFIIQDGNLPELLAFKCPCGCGDVIVLNLLPDASPRWKFNIDENNVIDIYPSVWRTVGCKSHFFVTTGNVIWV